MSQLTVSRRLHYQFVLLRLDHTEDESSITVGWNSRQEPANSDKPQLDSLILYSFTGRVDNSARDADALDLTFARPRGGGAGCHRQSQLQRYENDHVGNSHLQPHYRALE